MVSYSKSPLAFEDMKELFERAMQSPKGISVTCRSRRQAMNTRSRLNYLRQKDREANKEIYPTEHPLWGNSAWDRFVLRIPYRGEPHDNVLFIEKRTLDSFVICDLAEGWKPTDVGLPSYDDEGASTDAPKG
jgi:hypothetical protein